MIDVDVVSENNYWNKRIKKKFFFFNSLVNSFPKKYRYTKKKVKLTVLLSNNKNIKKLNKKFRKKNMATDVLSFPSEKKFNLKKNPYLGDIVVSYEFLNKPKNLSNLEFKKKLIKIFIHAFLHLLGHDHVKLRDFKKMLKEEEKIYIFIKKKVINFV
ncbi:rRNA maturation RNase YbeY [Candidatus Pelagibacter bacterium]|jgi:probable rRNA maturation factor|nr:rRNA maturation RNase YbeY [Candidatus Pelagibacter bacterium]